MTQVPTTRSFDPELTGYQYPRAVQFYEAQTLRMAYMCAEPESSNQKSVLLLHGKNFSGAYWEPHCYQFTFQALAYNTRGLLDLLDVDRVHVVGHSMDGMLATRFALMFPERTEQLALVNPIGLEDWKALGVPFRTVDENYAQELKTTPEGIREYERMSYFGGQWNSALTSDMIFTQPVLYEFPLIATRTLLIIGQRRGDRRRRPPATDRSVRPIFSGAARVVTSEEG